MPRAVWRLVAQLRRLERRAEAVRGTELNLRWITVFSERAVEQGAPAVASGFDPQRRPCGAANVPEPWRGAGDPPPDADRLDAPGRRTWRDRTVQVIGNGGDRTAQTSNLCIKRVIPVFEARRGAGPGPRYWQGPSPEGEALLAHARAVGHSLASAARALGISVVEFSSLACGSHELSNEGYAAAKAQLSSVPGPCAGPAAPTPPPARPRAGARRSTK